MKAFLKTYWKTLLFFAVAGIVGGFLVGLFILESYPPEVRREIAAQGISDVMLGVITAAQAAGYGIVLGALGILMGKKTGLWKDEIHFEKKPLLVAAALALVGGLAMILADALLFAPHNQVIMDSYSAKPNLVFWLASVIYGGIIEEVMLRLFFMSLLALVLHKLFGKSEKPGAAILISANALAALLFAAGHLPATFTTLGSDWLLIFRCFLLNGGVGLLLGFLYRKYGLRYAMLAHAGCHVVSKLIWILFW